MTIALHWWALPVAIVIVGLVFLMWPRQSSGGYIDLSGLGDVMVFFACVVVAAGICVGHWL
jgi:hypothetical protein